jgi:hypothetical protein
LIARGILEDTNVIAQPGFTNTIDELVARMRQGRAYVNLHTVAHPAGEIRGQVRVTDQRPVSHYSDPEFSWKYEVAPAGIGFINSTALGSQYFGDLIVGAARDFLQGGTLFRFELGKAKRGHGENDAFESHRGNPHRRTLKFEDPRLADRVADNLAKFDITESETLLWGTNFGIVTDIHTGPDGKLYLVSLSKGAVYQVSRNPNLVKGKPDPDDDKDGDDDKR